MAHWLGSVPTADLLALRAAALKYSEDQPRDEHGRWTKEGWIQAHPEPTGVSDIHSALAYWVGLGYGPTRGSVREGSPTSAAVAIINAVHTALPGAPTLYRGVHSSLSDPQALAREFQVGKKLELNISSWSRRESTGISFAGRDAGRSYVLELERGAKAIAVNDILPDSPWRGQNEWITQGRFTVTSVRDEFVETPGYTPIGRTFVTLRQDATLEPDELFASKAEKPKTVRLVSGGPKADQTAPEPSNAQHAIPRPSVPNEPKHTLFRSGGKRRDGSLNPIIQRVREQLIALADEHRSGLKYSPDQPRDEAGRFASGYPSEGTSSQVEAEQRAGGGPAYFARLWSEGASRDIRATLSGHWNGAWVDESHSAYEAARSLVKAVNSSPPTTYPLYRGISLPYDKIPAFQEQVQAGKTVDMNLSSWTKSESVAKDFANNAWGTGSFDSAGQSVEFRLEPGAHAYDATNYISQGPQYTEHLTEGRFEVTKFDHNETDPGAPYYTVWLKQIATLGPDQLVGTKLVKYDESEPRDSAGKWTEDGSANPPIFEEAPGFADAWQEATSEREQLAVMAWQQSPADSSWIRHHPDSAVGKIFASALAKAPQFTGTVYRGIDERGKDGKVLSLDSARQLWADRVGRSIQMDMVSSTPVFKEATQYGDTIFRINGATSRDIRGLGIDMGDGPNDYPENVLPPATYTVKDVSREGKYNMVDLVVR